MKKWISLLLVSVLIFSLLGMSACGEKDPLPLPENDSFSISEEELEKLQSQVGNDTVVKVWNSSAVSLFGKGLSLQEIINPPYALESGYIHASKGDSTARIEYIRNDKVFGVEAPGVTPKIFFDYICDQPYLFSSTPATNLTDVEVYKVYCILSADAANSVVIYYNTNHGDFVYYLPYATSENEYLLPLDAFQEATKAYRREIRYKNSTSPGWVGMLTLEDLSRYPYDLSPYLIDVSDDLIICYAPMKSVTSLEEYQQYLETAELPEGFVTYDRLSWICDHFEYMVYRTEDTTEYPFHSYYITVQEYQFAYTVGFYYNGEFPSVWGIFPEYSPAELPKDLRTISIEGVELPDPLSDVRMIYNDKLQYVYDAEGSIMFIILEVDGVCITLESGDYLAAQYGDPIFDPFLDRDTAAEAYENFAAHIRGTAVGE